MGSLFNVVLDELIHALSVSWQVSGGWSQVASLTCLGLLWCFLAFLLHVVSLKESSLGIVTRVQYFKRVIMKGASWGLGLEVLPSYFFQDILVKVSHKDSLDSRGRKIVHLFIGDSHSSWSCLMYHKCQYVLSLIIHSLIVREFLQNLFPLENIQDVSIFYSLSFCTC